MGEGWCHDCGDSFHLDDTGGYNPPCPCGCGMCRGCCEAEKMADRDADQGWWDDAADYPYDAESNPHGYKISGDEEVR